MVQPRPFVLELVTTKVKEVELGWSEDAKGKKKSPAHDLETYSFGQLVWTPDSQGLVAVGWPHGRERLGMFAYDTRPCALLHVLLAASDNFLTGTVSRPFEDDDLEAAANPAHPRFQPDGRQLVFFATGRRVQTHRATSGLFALEWPPAGPVQTLVGIAQVADDRGFPGLYLPQDQAFRPLWLADNRHVIVASQVGSTDTLLCIDAQLGEGKERKTESRVRMLELPPEVALGTAASLLDIADNASPDDSDHELLVSTSSCSALGQVFVVSFHLPQ